VPRTVDGAELALRAVLGQQVSTAAARTHAGRLVEAAGEPVDTRPAG
jgi:AraC family transcriptional regulator of adaptative response / DNA-3-methyladenine glycosylase II